MSERESFKGPDMNRRGFLRSLRDGAAVAYVGTYVGFEGVKAIPFKSELEFTGRQQASLLQESMKKGERQATIVLGGLTVKDASEITDPLTPTLERLDIGPIGNGIYAENSTDPASFVAEMKKLQDTFGINTFSFYGHSIGPHIVGQVIESGKGILSPYKVKYVFGDSTPPESGYGHNPRAEQFLSEIYPLGNDPLLTMGLNALSYNGDVFHAGTARPPLIYSQVEASKDSSNLEIVASKLREDGGKFIYLRTEDPSRDQVVDISRSQPRLEGIFGNTIQTLLIGGELQKHANPQENIEGYSRTLAQLKPIER